MRILFIATCLANIAFAFGSLPWMPNPMASHFDLDGTPNGAASPMVLAIIISTATVFSGTIFLSTSWLMTILPSDYFSIPNGDYWLNEENRPQTIRRICSFTELMGVWMMLFILLIQWEIFQANQTVPTKLGNNVHIASGVFLLTLTVATVRLLLAFRLPKEPVTPDTQ
jgi:uncharacterized membrane protein